MEISANVSTYLSINVLENVLEKLKWDLKDNKKRLRNSLMVVLEKCLMTKFHWMVSKWYRVLGKSIKANFKEEPTE